MFGLGFSEILFIAILALLFIGPDKLPDTMRTIARTLGKIKRALDDTKATLEQELRVDDLRAEVMQYRQELEKAKSDLSSFKNIASKEVASVKEAAQIDAKTFEPSGINDNELLDDIFEDADSEFDALEKEAKKSEETLKNKSKEENSDNEKKESAKKAIGFKHLEKKDN